MHGKHWYLDNMELAARRFASFQIPAPEERRSRAVGELVRLIFVLDEPGPEDPRAERMWVEITDCDDGYYQGRLSNQPLSIPELEIGDPVSFGAEHIAQTYQESEDPLGAILEKQAFVTVDILDGSSEAGFMYREAPDRAQDSGWRVISVDADDQYTSDVANVALVCISHLLDLDPSLGVLFEAGEGAAFERPCGGEPWQEAGDFEPEG